MMPTGWDFATLLAKCLIYLGTAALAGTLFYALSSRGANAVAHARRWQYAGVGMLLALLGSVSTMLLQVGAINNAGLSGMFDWGMLSILLETPNGEATYWRVGGIAVALSGLIAGVLCNRSDPKPSLPVLALINASSLIGLLLLLNSYRLTGHVSVLGGVYQLALVLHVLAFAAWIGSLPLFHLALVQQGLTQGQAALSRFGDQALALVIVLGLAGVILLFGLLASPGEIFTTNYGLALRVKLVWLLGILGIAALNRWVIVPRITYLGSPAEIKSALVWECVFAGMILLTTAYLSTMVGPMDHGH